MIENGIARVSSYVQGVDVPIAIAALVFGALMFGLKQDKLGPALAIVGAGAVYFVSRDVQTAGVSFTTLGFAAILIIGGLLLRRVK